MAQPVVIDEREITITPVFKVIQLENVPQSESKGELVMENHEVVEVRFAGSRHFSPVFPASAMWKREGNQVITYAERWADQYRAFKEGNPQEANGSPLEMLRRYGVTPEQISLCRTLRIYSVEALHHLEGQAAKSLGVHQNKLKQAAASFIAEHANSQAVYDEIASLKAQIAALQAQGAMVAPEKDSTVAEIDAAVTAASGEMTDDQLRDEIERLTGARPHHKTSRANLELALSQARAA